MANIKALKASRREIEVSPIGPGDGFEGRTLYVLDGRPGYSEPSDYPPLNRFFTHCEVEVIEESGHNPHFAFQGGVVSRKYHITYAAY